MKFTHILLFIILFVSLGIRFFDGQGIALSLLLLILSSRNIIHLNKKDLLIFLFFFSFIVLISISNGNSIFDIDFYMNFTFGYQCIYFLGTYFFLINYRLSGRGLLEKDFFDVVEFFCYHAIIGYIVFILLPNSFHYVRGTLNMSFYSIFYVGRASFMEFKRNSGLFWEPGILQMIANFYLFLCIKNKENLRKIILGILLVCSTFSTVGFLILIFNLFYFFVKNKSVDKLIWFAVPIIALLRLIIDNFTDKVISYNTSSLIRLRDLKLGIQMIIDRPILGLGIFNTDLLIKKRYSLIIEKDLLSNIWVSEFGLMAGGYTNGFLWIFICFGIPFGVLIFYFFINNSIINSNLWEKVLFNLIFIFSLISEPISDTSFFVLFPLSFIVLSNKTSFHGNLNNSYNI